METVFHDVPFVPGLKSLAKRKLKAHHYSPVLFPSDLVLADLSNTALRNLGIKRGALIDCEKDVYPLTRKWAEAIHAQCPDIQGLCWVSRQDDRSLAIVLFGDRIGKARLIAQTPSVDIVNDTATYADIITLAGHIGVKITADRVPWASKGNRARHGGHRLRHTAASEVMDRTPCRVRHARTARLPDDLAELREKAQGDCPGHRTGKKGRRRSRPHRSRQPSHGSEKPKLLETRRSQLSRGCIGLRKLLLGSDRRT